MKHILGLLFLVLLQSCVEVGFRNPQPQKGKELDKIPSEIIAFYTEQGKDSDEDGFSLADLGGEIDETGELSNNSVLKYWKGRYFFNQKKDSLWFIIMIVPEEDKTYSTFKMDGGNEKTVATLKQITDVREIYSESGELELVIIDPSPSQFKKIVKSNAFEKIDIF